MGTQRGLVGRVGRPAFYAKPPPSSTHGSSPTPLLRISRTPPILMTLDLPDDVLYLIAEYWVGQDPGDRAWVLLTRLLRTERGLLPWQLKIRRMDRPLRWRFWFNRTCREQGGFSCVAGVHWRQEVYTYCPGDIQCLVYDPTGASMSLLPEKITLPYAHLLYPEHVGYTLFPKLVFSLPYPSITGKYTVEMRWRIGLRFKITVRGSSQDQRHEILSFGSQNVDKIWTAFVRHHGFCRLPALLSPYLSAPPWPCQHECADFEPLRYWDIRHLRDLKCYLYGMREFWGDLSRWVIQPYHQIDDESFDDCGTRKLPQGLTQARLVRFARGELKLLIQWQRSIVITTVTVLCAVSVYYLL